MSEKLKEVFQGKVVNKAHTINTGVDEFPRYVLEYLIDNYCEEETFEEDKEKGVLEADVRLAQAENRHAELLARRERRRQVQVREDEAPYWENG